MRALLVLLGVLALPAWVFFTLIVPIPAISLFVAPPAIPVVFALIVVLVSPRVAMTSFLIGFSLATLVGAIATEALVRDVWRTAAPEATR